MSPDDRRHLLSRKLAQAFAATGASLVCGAGRSPRQIYEDMAAHLLAMGALDGVSVPAGPDPAAAFRAAAPGWWPLEEDGCLRFVEKTDADAWWFVGSEEALADLDMAANGLRLIGDRPLGLPELVEFFRSRRDPA